MIYVSSNHVRQPVHFNSFIVDRFLLYFSSDIIINIHHYRLCSHECLQLIVPFHIPVMFVMNHSTTRSFWCIWRWVSILWWDGFCPKKIIRLYWRIMWPPYCCEDQTIVGNLRYFLYLKYKVHRRTGYEGAEREYRYSTTLYLTSELDGVGGKHHTSAAVTPGNAHYPLYNRVGGLQCQSGQVRKILASPGFDPCNIQPVVSHNTIWAVLAHCTWCMTWKNSC
jgi:hypothetical protein